MRFSAQKTHTVGAFTLIELMIVVGIIAILTSIMIPSFNFYIANQNLKQAQEQIKNDLRTVQNKALTGALSADASAPLYWGVKFTDNSTKYTYFTSHTADASGCSAALNPASSEGLPAGLVTRVGGSGTYCIFFNMDNGNIVNTDSIIVGKTGATGSNCRRVTLTEAGLIQINTTNLLCP